MHDSQNETVTKITILIKLILTCCLTQIQAQQSLNYTFYHQRVVDVETLIASEKYEEALQAYESLFEQYEFTFLRDYQIATQLALYLNDDEKAKSLLIKGIQSGWTMKSIRKNGYLRKLRKREDWNFIKKQYHSLNAQYESSLNQNLKESVKKMFSKDQWKALGALLTFNSDAQDRYAEKKFAPHSKKQIAAFLEIIDEYGYPGEKLIGNNFWMSTILSHHNSISTAYNKKDTLYEIIKPKLWLALEKGQISAFEYVLIDEWCRATKEDKTYGILDGPLLKDLESTNQLRKQAYLRSIEVHNKLIDIQGKTGMSFYLDGHPWSAGKIEIR